MEKMTRLEFSEACRYCHNQTWLSDADGPLHPCCKQWIEAWGHAICDACRTAKALREQHARGVYARLRADDDHNDY